MAGRASDAATRRPGVRSIDWQRAVVALAASLDVGDALAIDDAPGHAGSVPIPHLSSLEHPFAEPAAPRPPVIARNLAAPRRTKVPASSTDDVPTA